MEATLIIAKVLGVYFIVSGVFVVTRKKTLMLVLKDLFEHPAISFVIGFILVIGGASLIFSNPGGQDSLSLFIKIISWIILIKGVVYILFPKWLQSFTNKISMIPMTFIGSVITLIGIYLIFFL